MPRENEKRYRRALLDIVQDAPLEEPEYQDWGGDTEAAENWGGDQERWRLSRIALNALDDVDSGRPPVAEEVYRVSIDMNNAAFEEDTPAEVVRILRGLVDMIEAGYDLTEVALLDVNGNRVGTAGRVRE